MAYGMPALASTEHGLACDSVKSYLHFEPTRRELLEKGPAIWLAGSASLRAKSLACSDIPAPERALQAQCICFVRLPPLALKLLRMFL